MSRQVVIFCDRHRAKDEHSTVTGSARFAALSPNKPMMLDMCDPCWDEVVVPLRDLLEEFGQDLSAEDVTGMAVSGVKRKPPRRPGRARGEKGCWVCPFPECRDNDPMTVRNSIAQHLRTRHDVSIIDIEAQGIDLDSKRPEDLAKLKRAPCRYPGCEESFANNIARGMHERMHGREFVESMRGNDD